MLKETTLRSKESLDEYRIELFKLVDDDDDDYR